MTAEDDLPGRMGELIRYGTIDSVDLPGGRIAVRVGEIVTANLRWLTGAAGGTSIWIRPKVGEQVVLFAPDADIEGAIAMRGVVCNAFPPIGDQDRDVIRFEDGAELAYDPVTHGLEATLPGGGKATVTAPGGIKFVGDVEIQGQLKVTDNVELEAQLHAVGEISSDDDVKAGSISLKTHKHGQVQPGSGISGVPQ
ncbi:phage baseplate assembly protein V [Sphingomonas kyeonggiensis]|uniref:phage baseplate assembly protein V n=1 Tax=Sphingomonas kyeonggiensis TaxID=1268553 RepID=UPI002780B265|nr:phage baseplate assembly protein V [Sphingomonas kyeonggiensis]MDQ0250957.1 phage baseplate assembly protein V [Sphingomonas kyeonggiensis]